MILKHLVRLDKYWSKLATAVNVWRSPHQTARMFQEWVAQYKAPRAAVVFKRLPPRPLRGRWGACQACEDHYIKAGYHETSSVVWALYGQGTAAPVGRAGRDRGVSSKTTSTHLTEDPDAETYKIKLGRWISAMVDALTSRTFWINLHVASITRTPLVHLMHWLQKAGSGPRSPIQPQPPSRDARDASFKTKPSGEEPPRPPTDLSDPGRCKLYAVAALAARSEVH
jgi:hypothetical protein